MRGIDTIAAISPSKFKELKDEGYTFFIGRVGRSNGLIDNIGVQNIKNAWEGGMNLVEAYLFPSHSTSAGTAQEQVRASVNALACTNIDRLWIDVEIHNWPVNQAINRQFILDMIAEAKVLNVPVGIYSNKNNWQSIVGLDWSGVSEYPLWWARYDNQSNCDSFASFGGWSVPAMKQYAGDVSGPCSVGNVDLNWRP